MSTDTHYWEGPMRRLVEFQAAARPAPKIQPAVRFHPILGKLPGIVERRDPCQPQPR